MSYQAYQLTPMPAVVEPERPNVPTFEECMAALVHLLPTLTRAFEDATREAREYFEKKHRDWDPFFAPHQVRYLVKEFLKDQNLNAEEFELEALAYSGLSLLYRKYHLKIFKSINGEVPPPGPSKPRRRFYAQQESFFAALAKEEAGVDEDEGTVNLILLWDFDDAHRLSNFWLVCPKAGGNSKESVEWHWHERVPYTAELLNGEMSTEPVGEDLPIQRKRVLAVQEHD